MGVRVDFESDSRIGLALGDGLSVLESDSDSRHGTRTRTGKPAIVTTLHANVHFTLPVGAEAPGRPRGGGGGHWPEPQASVFSGREYPGPGVTVLCVFREVESCQASILSQIESGEA